jgi:hypothetical protein
MTRLSIKAAYTALAALAIAIIAIAPAAAEGPTIVTVAGKIGKTNRGPVDPFVDIFFKNNDIAFDRAYAFDRDALAALGMHKLTITYPGGERKVEVEGPLLRDVLEKVGATGATATPTAIDGYAADIPIADATKWPIVFALKSNGEWLGLGGRGPAWIVYPVDDHPEIPHADDAGWVWAVYFIRVE